jgi:outer membrane immunogenic protein
MGRHCRHRGVEYALFRNWSAKVEYDFMDFGTHNENFHFTGPTLPGGSLDLQSNDREQVHVVRFGLNYRFGGDHDFAPMK